MKNLVLKRQRKEFLENEVFAGDVSDKYKKSVICSYDIDASLPRVNLCKVREELLPNKLMGKYFSEFIYVISKDVDLHKKCSSIFKYISFFDGVLFLSFKGFDREINLTKSSLRPSVHDFEFVYRVAVDFFDEIFEGVASEDDVVWNCRKIRFYNKEKESSPLMMKLTGDKIKTSCFAQENNIPSPRVIGIKDKGVWVKEPRFQDLHGGLVVKSARESNGINIYVLEEIEGGVWRDLNSGLVYDRHSLVELSEKLPDCVIEEKIGKSGTIPRDYKVYCYDGVPRSIIIYDKNNPWGDKRGYYAWYSISKDEFFQVTVGNFGKHRYPSADRLESMREELDLVGPKKISDFASRVAKKAGFNGFLSIDLFFHDGNIYLGELTRGPGAFVLRMITHDALKADFGDCLDNL